MLEYSKATVNECVEELRVIDGERSIAFIDFPTPEDHYNRD